MDKSRREIARETIEKYLKIAQDKGTSFSKRYLGSVIYHEKPDMFKDEEDGRLVIRDVLGSRAGHNTNHVDDYLREQWNFLEQPVREIVDTSFIVPKQYTKALVINDIHSRFYDREATRIAIESGIKENCNVCIINGDLLDFYQYSKFDKNPNILPYFLSERDWAIDFLEILQNVFGKVIFKKGNHDIRRELHIRKKLYDVPEMEGLIDLDDYLNFNGSTVDVLEDTQIIEFGKLNIMHGHEYYGNGMHIAYNRLNKTFDNTLSAHSHVSQQSMRRTIRGEMIGSWAVGCLCNLHPRYCPKNNWVNGFAIVEREGNGDFLVQNRQIVDGKIF